MRVALEPKRATCLRERAEDLVPLEILGVQDRLVPRYFPIWYRGIIGEDLPYDIVWKLSESSGLLFNGCVCCTQCPMSVGENYVAYAVVMPLQWSQLSRSVQTF